MRQRVKNVVVCAICMLGVFLVFVAMLVAIDRVTVVVTRAGAVDFEGVDKRHFGPNHWYDYYCCNKNDCRRAEPGELKWSPAGWLHTPSGFTFPHDKVREIPDEAPEEDKLHMHVCIHTWQGYNRDLNRTMAKGTPRCIYQQRAGG